MRKKLGIIIVALGVLLLGTALVLLGKSRAEDAQAGQAAEQAVTALRQQIEQNRTVSMETRVTEQTPEASDEGPLDADLPTEEELSQPAPVAMVGEYEYLGVLSLPALGLELPVMADWDYERLKLAPCRQFGSVETDNLVIAGHNYINHFANLNQLKAGDSVTFTTMDGAVHSYTVSRTDVISPDETEKVADSGYALVLYTCTYGRKSRVTIYCDYT